jgi:integrase
MSKPATRRGHGEGSIGRLGKRWRVRVSVRGADGRRKQIALYAPTRAEASKLLISTARQRAQHEGRPGHIGETVEQYMRRWLDYASKTTRPSTCDNYRGWAARYVIPVIGKVRLADLTAEHADKVTAYAQHAGLASGTVHNVRVMFGSALNRAVKWQIPGVRNVMALTAGPKVVRKEQRYLNTEQARQFIDAIKDAPMEAFLTVALYGGLRLGELQAITWDTIDFDKRTLRVRRSYRDGRGLGEVKTDHSNRTIDLSAPMVAVLRTRRKAQMADQAEAGRLGMPWMNSEGFAFTNQYGLLTDRNAIRREFHAALRKARLPMIRLHDLRHSCATLQLAAGVQPKVVQENLGHAKVSTTLDLYAHVMPSTRREAADTLAALLG